MNNTSPLRPPEHPSYQRHRRQLWIQIVLPILLAALLFAALTLLAARAAFQTGGDVSRWAAISTIWLTLPVLLGGLIAGAVLVGMIVLFAQVSKVIPPYSGRIQRVFYRIEYGTKRLATMVHRPILIVQGLVAVIRTGIDRAWERIG